MKNLLIIGDPLSTLHQEKDSTLGMIYAAWRLGLTVDYAKAQVAYSRQHGAGLWVQPLSSTEDFTKTAKNWQDLSDYAAILLRYDPPVNAPYREITQLLDTFSLQKPTCRVSNRPASLLRFNEKLLIFQFSQWLVPTLVSRAQKDLLAFLEQEEKIVLKPLDGLAGRGIFVLEKTDSNRFALLELLTDYGQRAIMVQRFLPQITEKGDKRILLVHGKVPPFGLIRRPKPGEHRANLAVGGSSEVAALTPREQAIAESMAPFCQAHGLDFVGLDIIDGQLTEVNITSPTGARQIAAATGYDPCEGYLQGLFFN